MANAYNQTRLQKVEVALQSVWGTAETTGFLNLACEPPTPPVGRTMYERPAVTGGFYRLAPIAGPQSGQELTISIPIMHGVSSTSPTANPTAHPEALFLESILGASNIGHYDAAAVSTSSTTTAVKIASAKTYSDWDVGQAGIFQDASGDRWIGWIKTVTDGSGSDHTLDLFEAIPAAPASGTDTWGTITCYLSTDTSTFFTLRIGSVQANSRLVLEGCVPRQLTLSLDPGGVVRMEVAFWVNSIAASSGALSDYTYTYPTLPPCIGANAARASFGSSATAVQTMRLQITQDLVPVADWNADSGVAAVATVGRSVNLEYTKVLGTSAPLLTTGSNTSHVLQVGSSPGNMMGILLPAGVHMAPGTLGDANGLRTQAYTYEQGQYTGDTGSTAPGDTAFRVCFG
jgi:hypothetical protein